MLKTMHVYLFENDHHLFVKSKRKSGNRYIYKVARIRADGSLAPAFEIKYERDKFVEAKGFKIQIQVIAPKIDKEKLKWQSLVDQAKRHIKEMLVTKDRKTLKKLRHEVSKLVLASVYYQNNEEGRCYDLRDFAKGIRLKDYSKLYRWVEEYLKTLYTPSKFKHAIPDAADSTLVTNYNQLKRYWDGIHGFNKGINALLVKNVKAYTKEMRYRGISVASL